MGFLNDFEKLVNLGKQAAQKFDERQVDSSSKSSPTLTLECVCGQNDVYDLRQVKVEECIARVLGHLKDCDEAQKTI